MLYQNILRIESEKAKKLTENYQKKGARQQ
jgi:hypothetical protein